MAKKRGEFEDVRSAILSTAANLFAKNGVHATSLADIAEDANLSKGTLYYYYQSKEHLLNDVADYHLGRITDIMLSWIEALDRETPVTDALISLLNMIINNDLLVKLHIALSAEATLESSSLKTKFASKYREWTVMLEVGSLRIPSFELDKDSQLSRMFFVILDGYLLQKAMNAEIFDLEALVALILK